MRHSGHTRPAGAALSPSLWLPLALSTPAPWYLLALPNRGSHTPSFSEIYKLIANEVRNGSGWRATAVHKSCHVQCNLDHFDPFCSTVPNFERWPSLSLLQPLLDVAGLLVDMRQSTSSVFSSLPKHQTDWCVQQLRKVKHWGTTWLACMLVDLQAHIALHYLQ